MRLWQSVVFGVFFAAFAQAETFKIACIGDSITWGHGLENRAAEGYPARLQALLGEGYEVRNFGNPGRGVYRHTAYNGGKRGYIFTPQHADALAWQPDAVICNLGANDADEYDALGSEASSRFIEDYSALLASYAALPSKPRLFIWSKLSPLTEKHRRYRSPAPFLMQRDLEIVAERLNAIGIDMQYPFETMALYSMSDGIHPNAKAMERIAEITHKAITPALTGAIPFTLPFYFNHAMVLPADTTFTIRGTAKPGTVISCGALSALTDWRGEWRFVYPATPPSTEGITLTFKAGDETHEIYDVLFGDLWICAGQSNMDLSVNSCDNAREIRAASTNANLRIFRWAVTAPLWGAAWSDAQLEKSKTRLGVFSGAWRRGDNSTAVAPLSGLGVMFGQGLLAARPGVPVGILQIAVGGAPVEAFLPKWGMAAQKPLVRLVTTRTPWYNATDLIPENLTTAGRAAFKNAFPRYDLSEMMHPFAPETIWRCAFEPIFFTRGTDEAFPVKGVVWYQGESNAIAPKNTKKAAAPDVMRAGIDALLESIRCEKRNAHLPIIMVQLPKFHQPWMAFREAQQEAAQAHPATGLVIATDTGDMKDIHPRDKKPIADRCLSEALRLAYGDTAAPAFTFAKGAARDGDAVVVAFTGPALDAAVSPTLVELSADGETFRPAMSVKRLDDAHIRVTGLADPAAIRYNWAPDTAGQLFNAAKLPVAPFRLNLKHNQSGQPGN